MTAWLHECVSGSEKGPTCPRAKGVCDAAWIGQQAYIFHVCFLVHIAIGPRKEKVKTKRNKRRKRHMHIPKEQHAGARVCSLHIDPVAQPPQSELNRGEGGSDRPTQGKQGIPAHVTCGLNRSTDQFIDRSIDFHVTIYSFVSSHNCSYSPSLARFLKKYPLLGFVALRLASSMCC